MTTAVNIENKSTELFREMLGAVLDKWHPRRESEKNLVGFSSLTGSLWSGELMVVGRFVNGWDKTAFEDVLADPEEFLSDVLFRGFHTAPCPLTMFWEEMREKKHRSPFWYTIRDVSKQLKLGEDWISKLVYSSLYRLGPDGGNPSDRLCREQLEGCRKLFQHELEARRPKRVLILAGWNWAKDFLQAMPMKKRDPDEAWQYVEYVGDSVGGSSPARIVVSKHPQGKPRRPLVSEVVSAFADNH